MRSLPVVRACGRADATRIDARRTDPRRAHERARDLVQAATGVIRHRQRQQNRKRLREGNGWGEQKRQQRRCATNGNARSLASGANARIGGRPDGAGAVDVRVRTQIQVAALCSFRSFTPSACNANRLYETKCAAHSLRHGARQFERESEHPLADVTHVTAPRGHAGLHGGVRLFVEARAALHVGVDLRAHVLR
eukprot:641655-Pleurochrysis_carterae.AAC.7